MSPEGTRLLREGRTQHIQGDYPGALRKYREAQAWDESSAEPHYWIGCVRLEQRRLEEAETEFTRALELGPNDARFYLGLARVCSDRGDLQGKHKSVQEATRAAGNEGLRQFALGYEAVQNNDDSGAVEHLRHAQDWLLDEPNVGIALGDRLLRLGRNEEAAEVLARASRARLDAPTLAMVLYNLGLAEKRLGHLDRAYDAFLKATEESPNYGKAYALLFKVELKRGNLRNAWRMFVMGVQAEQLSREGQPEKR